MGSWTASTLTLVTPASVDDAQWSAVAVGTRAPAAFVGGGTKVRCAEKQPLPRGEASKRETITISLSIFSFGADLLLLLHLLLILVPSFLFFVDVQLVVPR